MKKNFFTLLKSNNVKFLERVINNNRHNPIENNNRINNIINNNNINNIPLDLINVNNVRRPVNLNASSTFKILNETENYFNSINNASVSFNFICWLSFEKENIITILNLK